MDKTHYYLVQTYVTFVDSEGNTGIDNDCIVVQSDVPALNTRGLGNAQQGAQVKLFNKLGQPVSVLNVSFGAISYLGHMTDAEWNPDELPTETPAIDTVN